MGPQAGEAGNDVPHGQVRHAAARRGDGVIQPRLGGSSVVPILLIRGGGAEEEVSVDSGGHQHALAHGTRQLEDGMAHQTAVLPVQQAVFAPAGGDPEGIAAQLVMEHVAPYAGGVDHGTTLHRATAGVHHKVIPLPADMLHLRIEAELRAVGGSVLRQSNGQAEGAENGAGRGIQGRHRLLGQGRLHPVQSLALHDLQPLHAVGKPPLIEGLQLLTVRRIQTQHQCAAPAIGKVQLTGQGLHHAAALHVEAGLPAAGLGVEAGVDNGGIGLAGAGADVLIALHHTDASAAAAQLPCDGAADDAAADDQYIIHDPSLLSKNKKPRKSARRLLRAILHGSASHCMTGSLVICSIADGLRFCQPVPKKVFSGVFSVLNRFLAKS